MTGPAPKGWSTEAARPGGRLAAVLRSPVFLTRLKLAALGLAITTFVLVSSLFVLIASRDFSGIPARVAEAVQVETGGQLRFGKADIRYFPQPRIVFDALEFEHQGAGLSVKAGRAILRIGILDLIDGSLDQPHLELEAADIRLQQSFFQQAVAAPRGLTEFLEKLSGSFSGARNLASARITLSKARISIASSAQAGPDVLFEPVDARLRYRANAGRIDITARRNSALRPLEFSASLPTTRALVAREKRTASFRLAGFGSRGSFEGTMIRAPELVLAGRVEGTFQEDFEKLIGLSIGRGARGSDDQTRISGLITFDARGGGLEGLTISRGEGSLSGIASLRENAGR
ncbi:MAG: hypothetical protein ACRDBL_12900, partial [Rhabdaerophilum sp.]